MRLALVVVAAVLLLGIAEAASSSTGCKSSSSTKWATKQYGGTWRFTKDDKPVVLRGVSMTGWETGTREEASGAGFWLFEVTSSTDGLAMMTNIVKALASDWKMTIIRMPICGSAWNQNYAIRGYMNGNEGGEGTGKPLEPAINYHEWVAGAVCDGVANGMATIIDNHLWAIGRQTADTKNTGVEDGCTGYESPNNKTSSCAPHDWYGAYTAARTGKSYNSGDGQKWECPMANADGVTIDALFRKDSLEHFLNMWYDVATYFKSVSGVWFELYNEPYERKSAKYDATTMSAANLGDNKLEKDWRWKDWSAYNKQAIEIIRGICDNIVLVSGHDWSYDFLGDHSSDNAGPLVNPELIAWANVKNIGYAFHPYQHGTCCGKIGSSSDESKDDPYASAFCMYPPQSNGARKASGAALPSVVSGKVCDTIGYADTQNKKGPPCIWKAKATPYPLTEAGICAGDRDECGYLDEAACNKKMERWEDPDTGGWSKYVLPMQIYGPLIATEFGPFDCSSPFSDAFMKWCRMFGVSYTVWALWPQNSGGPGAGACGYPSIIAPNEKGNFVVCKSSCKLDPLPWSAPIIKADIAVTGDSCDSSPCFHGACTKGTCKCKKGWTGSKCDQKDASYTLCSPNPCLNGGTCIPVGPSSAERDTFVCKCTTEYAGLLCGVPASMKAQGVKCTASTCKNGGKCLEAGGQVVCKCANGENTPDCNGDAPQPPIDEPKENGTIVDPPIDNPTCNIRSCQNGGTPPSSTASASACKCTCKSGYSGTQCGTAPPTGGKSTGINVNPPQGGNTGQQQGGNTGQGGGQQPGGGGKCTVSCGLNGQIDSSCNWCRCSAGYEGVFCDKPCLFANCKSNDPAVIALNNNSNNTESSDNTILIIVIIVLVLLILGGAGYYFYRQQNQQKFMMQTSGMRPAPPMGGAPPAPATGYYRPPPPPGGGMPPARY